MSSETAVKVSSGIAEGFPWVQGTCPACGSHSLFAGSGGYLTCSVIGCTNPVAPSEALGVTFPTLSTQPDSKGKEG